MKRKQSWKASLAVGLIFCTLFSGCGGQAAALSGQEGFSAGQPESAQATAPLWGELTVYLEKAYTETVLNYPVWQALGAFQRENPQLTLRFESPVGGVSNYEAREAEITRLETEILAGGGPDVFLFGGRFTGCNLFPDLQKAMRNGAFAECGRLLAEWGTDLEGDDFWPAVMRAGRVGQAQYLVPLAFDVTVGLAEAETLRQSGFDSELAGRGVPAFIKQITLAYHRNPGCSTFYSCELTTNMALELLDYDTGRVLLSDPQVQQLLELDRACGVAPWNQGQEAFQAEYNRQYEESFDVQEAKRLAAGQRLMDLCGFSSLCEIAWQLAAQTGEPVFLPLPNENGGVTASVQSYAAIGANTQNPQAAAALIAFLLREEWQNLMAAPVGLTALPVRKSSLRAGVQSAQDFQRNVWWLDPTEEEKKWYQEEFSASLEEKSENEKRRYLATLGAPLPDGAIQSLEQICAKIDAAHFYGIWSHSVDLGKNPEGDSLIAGLYGAYLDWEITLEELTAQLEPRLQLYLDE